MSKERKPLVAKNNILEKELAIKSILEAQPKSVENMNFSNEKEIHRYNIEIPNDLFQEIKSFVKQNGYNIKGFFLTSAKEKITREENRKMKIAAARIGENTTN